MWTRFVNGWGRAEPRLAPGLNPAANSCLDRRGWEGRRESCRSLGLSLMVILTACSESANMPHAGARRSDRATDGAVESVADKPTPAVSDAGETLQIGREYV